MLSLDNDYKMSSWWKTAKNILSGKARGSKLIILGVFLMSTGAIIEIYVEKSVSASLIFLLVGMWTVQRGWFVYEEEARRELEKKYGSAPT